MKSMRHCIPTIWTILILTVSSAFAESRGIFYVVRSKDAAAYLLGSIHLGKKEFYPLPQHVEKIFQEAGPLVLEVDPANLAQTEMLGYALYQNGDELRKHIAPSTYELAVKEGALAGLPAFALDRMRPWMLAVTLQVLCMQKEGFSAEDGVELHFIRKGAGKKRVEELESADFQMKLLSGFSEKEQELFLLDTLRNLSDKSKLQDMIKAWQAGDAQSLERAIMHSLREHPEITSVYEKLFFSRNKGMAEKIEKAIKEKKSSFVIVGAGHLVGPRGVVEILRSRGYAIEQQ